MIECISQNRPVHRFYPWQLTIMIMMKMTMAVAMINDRRLTLDSLRFVFVSVSGKLSFNRFATFDRDNEFTMAIGKSFSKRIASNWILIDDIPPYKDVNQEKSISLKNMYMVFDSIVFFITIIFRNYNFHCGEYPF